MPLSGSMSPASTAPPAQSVPDTVTTVPAGPLVGEHADGQAIGLLRPDGKCSEGERRHGGTTGWRRSQPA